MNDATFLAELKAFVGRRGYELDIRPDADFIVPVKYQEEATNLAVPVLLLAEAPEGAPAT